MTDSQPIILWFRQDLRLSDNPAFHSAAGEASPVLPVYVLDDESAGEWSMGAASRWWLHHSLNALDRELENRLLVYRGRADIIIPKLAAKVNARGVYWNRCYEPWRMGSDKRLNSDLTAAGYDVRSFNGSLLFEPPAVSKADGTPYKVFTPFYRKGCLGGPQPRQPLGAPKPVRLHEMEKESGIDELKLLPETLWYHEMEKIWRPGEEGAHELLATFLEEGVHNYKLGRDRPDQAFVSRLSPHLHFGEISPHQVWYAAKELEVDGSIAAQIDHFLSELGWREFSNHLLYHWPGLPRENLQKKFDRFPWTENREALNRWQRGMTGYPIVDAGMRELWRNGYMHNRVRMIVGSFLVKNLLLHWHHGEDWFWDTLVDADLANNSASWQWIAGCGADAAPYFRIFNPVTQGQRFDPDGVYVRRYLPELAAMPNKFLHNPWTASQQVLDEAGIQLGKTYPLPIVDLKQSRERALAAFKSIRDEA